MKSAQASDDVVGYSKNVKAIAEEVLTVIEALKIINKDHGVVMEA